MERRWLRTSVARVGKLLTRTENDECASVYRIGAARIIRWGARYAAWALPSGCRIVLQHPARMKFLKKDSSEGTFVADIVAM